ncbi:hypothetical protein [Rhizobium paknamense]|uniref:Cytochrome P450 n=1 Tax=Rhizobium paknamense TaxID=1206817 RepID=A0ABU0IMA2_9HYPH|nr:hypothetical protein [Rhizobium paknamense]MDQ0458361.1 hypothetical protein [Rhizobium paknamense]
MVVIIENYEAAARVLRDNRNLSDRQSARLAAWEAEYPDAVGTLMPFLSQWLMYMDTGEHHSLRRAALSILSADAPTITEQVFDALGAAAGKGEITFNTCISVAAAFHRVLFGLSQSEQEFVIAEGDNILNYMFSSITKEKLIQAAASVTRLEDWVQQQTDRPGLLGAFVTAKLPVAVCINLLVDSYHPVIAATTTVVWKWGKQLLSGERPDDGKERVAACLRQFPPFTMINRRVLDSPTEMYSIQIEACNRGGENSPGGSRPSQKYGMTFGAGKHSCLGAGVSLSYLYALNGALLKLQAVYNVTSVGGEIGSDDGHYQVNDLLIGLEPS